MAPPSHRRQESRPGPGLPHRPQCSRRTQPRRCGRPPRGQECGYGRRPPRPGRRPFGRPGAPGARGNGLVFARTHRGDDVGAGPSRELDGAHTDRTGAALDQRHAARDRPRDMHSAMGGDAGDAEAGPLLEGDAVGERHGLPRRDGDVLGGRAEGAITLRPVAPHPLPDPRRGRSLAHPVDGSRAVAVGDDAGVRHPVAEGVLSLFHVAGVDAGGGDADAHLPRARLGVRHRPDDEDVTGGALFLVPGRVHGTRPSALRGEAPDPGVQQGDWLQGFVLGKLCCRPHLHIRQVRPNGYSGTTETGLLKEWRKNGPKLLWQVKVLDQCWRRRSCGPLAARVGPHQPQVVEPKRASPGQQPHLPRSVSVHTDRPLPARGDPARTGVRRDHRHSGPDRLRAA